jgi:hypothetical protein
MPPDSNDGLESELPNMATAYDAAQWMFDEVSQKGELYQADAVSEIERRFGKEFIYINDNGNPAIAKDVLKHFRKLTADTLIWERSYRYWRQRTENDTAGRRRSEY